MDHLVQRGLRPFKSFDSRVLGLRVDATDEVLLVLTMFFTTTSGPTAYPTLHPVIAYVLEKAVDHECTLSHALER